MHYINEEETAMFCQECGHKNEDSSAGMFCESCGAKLEVTTKQQPSLSVFDDSAYNQLGKIAVQRLRNVDLSKAKTMSKKTKKLIIIVAALVAAAVALVIAGSELTNPQRIVKAYFESYVAGNYEKAYSYLSLPKSQFLTKQAFSEHMRQENFSNMDIASYEIVNPNKGRSGNDASQISKEYQVNYILRGESSQKRFTVSLVRQDKKQLLFYNSYKVGLDDLIVREYIIYAPDGINLTFDGVALTQRDNTTDSYENLKVYVVDAAFRGNHTLTATSDLFEDVTAEISLSRSSSYEVLNNFEVKESIRAKLATNTYNVFAAMVQSAVKKGEMMSIENIANILTTNPEQRKGIQERYINLASHVKMDDGTGLKSISFKSSRDETYSSSLDRDGRYRCDVSFKYSYVRIYNDWWSGEAIEEASSGERDGSVRFYFAYEDSAWKIVSFDSYSLYY